MKKYGILQNFSRTVTGKTIAFILCVISLILFIASAAGICFCASENIYTSGSELELFRTLASPLYRSQAYSMMYGVLKDADREELVEEQNISIVIYDSEGNIAEKSYYYSESDTEIANLYFAVLNDKKHKSVVYAGEYPLAEDYQYHDNAEYAENSDIYDIYTAKVYIRSGFPVNDNYRIYNTAAHYGYMYRYVIIIAAVLSLLISAVTFINLMCASARMPNSDELHPGPFNRVPFDIITLLTFIAICVPLSFLSDNVFSNNNIWAILIPCSGIFFICVFLGWCMSLSARVKQKNLFKNTLVFNVLRIIWLGICGIHRFNKKVFSYGTVMWRTILILSIVTVTEFVAILICWFETDNLMVFWIIEKLIINTVIIITVTYLCKIEAGGKALADGNLGYKIDTAGMHGSIRRHGENLNKIGEGMSKAVEQRMKIERMKTELITNVSHDIKTPLTSIVNYADLISQEPTDNEKIKEYSEVLQRQSQRLKRLTEDLIEASKASSGNLDVQLVPCDAGIFITQIAGEYSDSLTEAGLTLVAKQSDIPITIMADSRRMQRIFDNLMSNIRKYSLTGTRVYISLEEVAGNAVFILKNTSRSEMDMTEDELFERFTRGDSSRHTDGNGLGLSIAKSLTELQKGSMHIYTDGDLFKVILTFPIINQATQINEPENQKN